MLEMQHNILKNRSLPLIDFEKLLHQIFRRKYATALGKHFNCIKSKEFLSFCYLKLKKKTLGKIFLY
jgi:hypothetical protein